MKRKKVKSKTNMIVCDWCKNEFPISSIHIEEEQAELLGYKDCTVMYFSCPKCERKYAIFVRNKKVDELQESIRGTKENLANVYAGVNPKLMTPEAMREKELQYDSITVLLGTLERKAAQLQKALKEKYNVKANIKRKEEIKDDEKEFIC